MNNSKLNIAILGGTGDLGTGLARCWLQAGHHVILGSRTFDKAQHGAEILREKLTENGVKEISLSAADNLSAAVQGNIVAMTVPFAHHASTLESIKPAMHGKILIDVTVPLVPPRVARVQLPDQGSAGQIAQAILGEEVQVVSAFQNVAAHHLNSGTGRECDVLVCGNSKDARAKVIGLVQACGMRGIHAGSIANAAAVEAMTSLLIFINKQYKAHSGIHITGIA